MHSDDPPCSPTPYLAPPTPPRPPAAAPPNACARRRGHSRRARSPPLSPKRRATDTDVSAPAAAPPAAAPPHARVRRRGHHRGAPSPSPPHKEEGNGRRRARPHRGPAGRGPAERTRSASSPLVATSRRIGAHRDPRKRLSRPRRRARLLPAQASNAAPTRPLAAAAPSL
jgi:hypothetical protein